MSRLALSALFLSLLNASASPGQAFVERITPPAAERGKTTRLTFVGADLEGPLDLWTSLPAGKVRAVPVAGGDAARAAFDVTLADDAPVGICGVRVATAGGLSNAHLFLIDDLPLRPAPDSEKGPAKVELPVAVWGAFREARVDRFSIDVEAGRRVSFEAVGNRFGTDADPLVTVRDSQGRIVAEHDNDPGLYFDCRFEHIFKDAGTYTVELRDSRFHGSEQWPYVLRMGRFPAARVSLPTTAPPGKHADLYLPEIGASVGFDAPADLLTGPFFAALRRPGEDGSAWLPLEASDADVTVEREPNDTMEQATPAKVPGVLCGVLGARGDRDFFRLDLAAGQKIRARGEARPFNSPADLELVLTDAKGKEIRRVSDTNQDEFVNLEFTAPAAGAYGLMVHDLARDGGPAFTYRLDVRGGPQIAVTADVEGLTVPCGSYQPVPLSVVRTDYAGPVALTLDGAPAGVTLTPNEIPAGVDGVVFRLSAAVDSPGGIHSVRILAQMVGAADAPRIAVRTQPLIDRRRVNVDLIPYALREDQRRLPPSLTDRLALQVTPPAPFTMELPEKVLTLARYQYAEFPIVTTRADGFDGPITFTAHGGQLGDKSELRSHVYAEFPQATPATAKIMGIVHSRILANVAKARIDVEGVGFFRGRRVALTRTFDLDLRTAFAAAAEPASVVLAPGEAMKVRLLANRVASFDGDVTVRPSKVPGVTLPESVVIPHGQASVEVEVKATADAGPGKVAVELSAAGVVDGYEEEQRGGRIDVEIRKPAAPKK